MYKEVNFWQKRWDISFHCLFFLSWTVLLGDFPFHFENNVTESFFVFWRFRFQFLAISDFYRKNISESEILYNRIRDSNYVIFIHIEIKSYHVIRISVKVILIYWFRLQSLKRINGTISYFINYDRIIPNKIEIASRVFQHITVRAIWF